MGELFFAFFPMRFNSKIWGYWLNVWKLTKYGRLCGTSSQILSHYLWVWWCTTIYGCYIGVWVHSSAAFRMSLCSEIWRCGQRFENLQWVWANQAKNKAHFRDRDRVALNMCYIRVWEHRLGASFDASKFQINLKLGSKVYKLTTFGHLKSKIYRYININWNIYNKQTGEKYKHYFMLHFGNRNRSLFLHYLYSLYTSNMFVKEATLKVL